MANISNKSISTLIPSNLANNAYNTRVANTNKVFATSINKTTYKLINSFILDFGLTSHICND